MAELKETKSSVRDFIAKVPNEQVRADAQTLLKIMKRVTKSQPKMWGGNLIGFGKYHYKYASGHEGDCFLAGFAARKDKLTMYITSGVRQHPMLMAKLGKHKAGGACVHVKKLSDVDLGVLERLLTESVAITKNTYS